MEDAGEEGVAFVGEPSGGFIFPQFQPNFDGMYAIARILEMLALQTEILELKANPIKPARGTVIEIERSPKKGVIAHVLVQNGTLQKGNTILCGNTFGKVRAVRDHTGATVKEVGISSPAQLEGLQDVPEAGDRFRVVENIQKARMEAERHRHSTKDKRKCES